MSDFSNCINDKIFSSTAGGCLMKFENDEHLMVHKQKRDMILNLGLGIKSNVDETPTPTQFFKNCEEVGLFQDLQNVNPFEETFKKAVEAVETGQQIYVGNSLQLNSSDDSLHTPNIFPHITEDVPIELRQNEWMKSENPAHVKNDIIKLKSSESVKINETAIAINHVLPEIILNHNKSAIPVKNSLASSQSSFENSVYLSIPQDHFVQFMTTEDSQAPCNFVILKQSNLVYPVMVKEKLKQSLNNKKSEKIISNKVPISKYPSRKNLNALNSKFSKFSKNALKLISKLESSENESYNLCLKPSKRQKKKNRDLHCKESKSEFLARSRAASSRCREKKKMYVLYLEKVNTELSIANKNLQLSNFCLKKQLRELQAELLKHQNCKPSCEKSESTLSEISCSKNIDYSKQESDSTELNILEQLNNIDGNSASTSAKDERQETPSLDEIITIPYFCSLDVAEIVLDDQRQENEIPLNENNKPPGIIVRFNSVSNDFPRDFPSDSYLSLNFESNREDVKKIYSEHSYFYLKDHIDIDKQLREYKNLSHSISTSVPSDQDFSNLKFGLNKSDAVNGQLNSMTQPPLILLKPFKKRTLQKKKCDKT